jgi:hypothetical protein
MNEFPGAWPHGPLREVFPDVFFVTGTMKTVIEDVHWHFSRNMTVVRDSGELTLINSVRLDDAGLAQLESLGRVTNLVKIGALHGIDDPFYKARYGATFWALPGMEHAEGLTPDKLLAADGEVPFAGCSVFVFQTTKLPECILRVDRAGGVLVACDALQNWVAPDEFFSDESRRMMTEMGFFQPANLGPLWMKLSEPKAPDFVRLRELAFRHALCGHGEPLRDTAKEAYLDRFQRVFGV